MLSSRGSQKFDRVTVTFVPSADEKSYRNVPSTFSPLHRSYEWRRSSMVSYMIVPKRISNVKIEVDVFVNAGKRGKLPGREVQKVVHDILQSGVSAEWAGLKLDTVGRCTTAAPPEKSLFRGSIEDILGVALKP
jgi:hypothetical protein